MSIDTIIATDVSPEITICPSKSLMLGTFTTDVKFTGFFTEYKQCSVLQKVADAYGSDKHRKRSSLSERLILHLFDDYTEKCAGNNCKNYGKPRV